MQHQEFAPPETLRETIKCFWYDDRDFGKQISGFEVVPDGYTEIIFHFGSPCSIFYNGNISPLPSPFLIGLLKQPVVFYSENRLKLIGIRCFPWTVFGLLGLPPGKDGIRTFEHPIAQLHPLLSEHVRDGRIAEAIALVSHYILNIQTGTKGNVLLSKAGTAMREGNGNMLVSQIAAAAHVTVRTLERKFKQSSGHTVKDVSALMRFEQVRNKLWIYPDTRLAGLALELGYTDQAHLTREFKRYSGTSPAAFARKAKKDFQGNDFVAFIQA